MESYMTDSKQIQVPYIVKTSFHEHTLIKHPPNTNTGWVCDGLKVYGKCHSGITDFKQTKGIQGWRCEQCNFDFCIKCIQISIEKEQNQQGIQQEQQTFQSLSLQQQLDQVKQKNTYSGNKLNQKTKISIHPHILKKHKAGQYIGWACDGADVYGACLSSITDFNQTEQILGYRCDKCNFNFCQKCLKAQIEIDKLVNQEKELNCKRLLKSKHKNCLVTHANQNIFGLPLQQFNLIGTINESIATYIFQQKYINTTEQPIEVEFLFPQDNNIVISQLVIQIADKTVEAKILEKCKAQIKYEDEIASGNTAVIASEDKKQQIVTLNAGNILPGQEINIMISLIQNLDIEGGAYIFNIPSKYFPDYTDANNFDFVYNFKIEIDIISQNQITYISCPKFINAEKEINPQSSKIQIRHSGFNEEIKKDLTIYYKTYNMDEPKFYYQESEQYKDEIACMISMVPTFIGQQNDQKLEIQSDEKPEQEEIEDNQNQLSYIFLVDRSGSMNGQRIETTVEALKLFIQSLPPGCIFNIISYGTSYEVYKDSYILYNDKTKDEALQYVSKFQADMMQNNEVQPLISAYKMKMPEGYQKKIFFLTDGGIGCGGNCTSEQIVQTVKEHSDLAQLFTIGIQCSGHDQKCVEDCAKEGQGEAFIIRQNQEIKSKVIQALSKASEVYLQNCSFKTSVKPLLEPYQQRIIRNLYRNQLLNYYFIIKKEQLNSLQLQFQCEYNPITQKGLNIDIHKERFIQIDNGDYLFKLTARKYIDLNQMQILETSLKYQVLSPETAFIGVIKQNQHQIGEIQQIKIKKNKDKYSDEDREEEYKGEYKRGMVYQRQDRYDIRDRGFRGDRGGRGEFRGDRGEFRGYRGGRGEFRGDRGEFRGDRGEFRGYRGGRGEFKGDRGDREFRGEFRGYRGKGGRGREQNKRRDSREKRKQSSDSEEEMIIKKYGKMMDVVSDKDSSRSSGREVIQKETKCLEKQSQEEENKSKTIIEKQDKVEPLLNEQKYQGFWNNLDIILCYLKSTDDAQKLEIQKLVVDQNNIQQIWITILALYIIQKKFYSMKDEFYMIEKKAKIFLQKNGIKKIQKIIDQISIPLL